jgi:uncharacterized surface protein with fasciclin (FAS1) repeats
MKLKTKTLFVGTAALSVLSLCAPSAKAAENVAKVAMSAPQFSTLVTAVKAAGLAPALSNTKNITVFAPTNAAFAKLPKGVLANLLKPENKATLTKILTYHVLPMKATSRTVTRLHSGTNVKTLGGEKVIVRKMNGAVYLDPTLGAKPKSSKSMSRPATV